MSDDLYREIILDHYRNPDHKATLEQASIAADEVNPLCGDSVSIQLQVDEAGVVGQAVWQGEGCAISVASADILSEAMIGMSLSEIAYLTKDDMLQLLGIDLGPSRLKCAVLALSCVHKGIQVAGYFEGQAGKE
jgi:nitrogen fixation NifU-like protein